MSTVAPLEAPVSVARGPVAVIDIGTSAVRMAIAEIDSENEVRLLDSLSQPLSLGKDTFTKGSIRKRTIEDCVRVLEGYGQILREYKISGSQNIRVVATSAVREASNRLAFIDRIYSATGLEIEPLDEAEVTRTTYLGILPSLQKQPDLLNSSTIVAEVGGGSTEVLIVERADVLFSHSYRLGSLRMREMLEAYHTPTNRNRSIMQTQIDRTLEEVRDHVPEGSNAELLALGGDIRFAARQLQPNADLSHPTRLKVRDLEKLTDRLLSLSIDELVQTYHLPFPAAETLGPALLGYVRLANILQLDSLLVMDVNLRNGLLRDLFSRDPWSEVLKRQIMNSGLDLARKFHVDLAHAQHVSKLASTLFRAYQSEHKLDPRYELVLQLAALVHEAGLFVSQNGYHKHTLYLIRNSELFGLGQTDLLLTALVARYHRRASPKPNHDGFGTLDRERRIAVAKLAGILRVADALDRSRSGRIDEIVCTHGRQGDWIISVPDVDDLALEQLALEQKGGLFEEIYGAEILLRPLRR